MDRKRYTFGEEINKTKASKLSRYCFKPEVVSKKMEDASKQTLETGQMQAFKHAPDDFDRKPSGTKRNLCAHLAH